MSIIINMLKSCDPDMITLGARLALNAGSEFCMENLFYKVRRGNETIGYDNNNNQKIIHTKLKHLYVLGTDMIICNGQYIHYLNGGQFTDALLKSMYRNDQTNFNKIIETIEDEIRL